MTVTREPLCTVQWCPAPADPEFHRCVCCGDPQGDHAHVESRAQNPARKKDKSNIIFLCRTHHAEVDLRQNGTHGHAIRRIPGRGRLYFRYDLHGNTTFQKVLTTGAGDESVMLPGELPAVSPAPVAAGGEEGSKGQPADASSPVVQAGSVLTALQEVGGATEPALMDGEEESQSPKGSPPSVAPPRVNIAAPRPSSPFSLESDWSDLDDETLQKLYEEGEHRQREGYLLRCKAVWQYRENHIQAWGESWTEQAIERFGCSRRYAYSYANLWQIYVTSDTYLREGMAALTDSRSLMQTIGRATVEDGARLLESAVAHVAEYAQPPSVKALVGAETPEREPCICPTCQTKHYPPVWEEWKA